MIALRRQSKVGLAIGLASIIIILATAWYYYSAWFAATDKTSMVDYAGKAWAWFISNPIAALFGETEGSAPWLKYLGIGLIWIWASFAIGHFVPRMEQHFWGNLSWCLAATSVVMVAWIYGAAAQHFQWYACFYHCYPGEEGTMDKVTHFLTPAAIMSILLTVNIMDSLHLNGRTGRAIELGIMIALVILIPVWWEWQEVLNPTLYLSIFVNSFTDMLTGWIGGLFTIAWYNWIVPYEA